MEKVRAIIFLIFILLEGIRDLHKRKISLVSVSAFGSLGILLQCTHWSENWMNLLGGIGVGAAVLLLAKITKEKIGYGDGWVLMVSGIYLGFYGNLVLLAYSLMATSAVAILLIVLKKAKKNTELPFVTFMFIGYIVLMIAGM